MHTNLRYFGNFHVAYYAFGALLLLLAIAIAVARCAQYIFACIYNEFESPLCILIGSDPMEWETPIFP